MWEQQGALLPTGEGSWRGRRHKGTEKVADPGLSVLGVEVPGGPLKHSMRWEPGEMPPTASAHPPPQPVCLSAVVLPTTLPVTHCHHL